MDRSEDESIEDGPVDGGDYETTGLGGWCMQFDELKNVPPCRRRKSACQAARGAFEVRRQKSTRDGNFVENRVQNRISGLAFVRSGLTDQPMGNRRNRDFLDVVRFHEVTSLYRGNRL